MKGDKDKAVVGVFSYLDDALSAVEFAKGSGYEYKVYSPVPNHHLEHATCDSRSPVRMFTLAGALFGITAGFTLAIMCSLDYPLRVSAKDIVSIPGFVVIGYECTILFGAIATLTGLCHLTRTPNIFRKLGYDPRFSYDKFGVVVSCPSSDVDAVSKGVEDSGAEEVNVENGL